jgi:hypothetical protein
MTNQQHADLALAQWQLLRDLPPVERIDALMALFFLPIPPCDVEFDAIIRNISEVMADA